MKIENAAERKTFRDTDSALIKYTKTSLLCHSFICFTLLEHGICFSLKFLLQRKSWKKVFHKTKMNFEYFIRSNSIRSQFQNPNVERASIRVSHKSIGIHFNLISKSSKFNDSSKWKTFFLN